MKLRSFLPVLAVFFGLVTQSVSALAADSAGPPVGRLLPGHWTATLILPNGIKITDDQKVRGDGFVAGRIVVYYRDDSVKYSYTYNCSWRVDGKFLISADIVSAPHHPELPDSTREEIIQADTHTLVLRDLANGIVTHYTRVQQKD